MLLPNPGSLIHSLRSNLNDSVLPALAKGDAQRQLKAALHLLGRLEKSWDLYGQHVREDNKDIETTIAAIFEKLSEAKASEIFKQLQNQLNQYEHVVESISGLNDPELADATHRNLQLQECLQNLEGMLVKTHLDGDTRKTCNEYLVALYRRMAMRDSIYVGDRSLNES